MTRRVDFDEALDYWQFAAAWWSPLTAIPIHRADWPRRKAWWARTGRPETSESGLAGQVRWLNEHGGTEIQVGLPRIGGWKRSLHDCGTGRCSLLWCRVEGSDQLARARRFKPTAALVFAEGSSSRRLLWWPLEEPRPWHEIKDANRRIAYNLRAMQKHADPETFTFVPPGTCLRDGRSKPVPVRVARFTSDTFHARDVAGTLRDPPAATWWEGRG